MTNNGFNSDGESVSLVALSRAQEPADLLAALKTYGFTDQDLSAGTATDDRTVRRWKKKGVPGATAARHLGEIRNVLLILKEAEVLTDRGVVFWMRHPNRLLEDYAPLEVLGAGGFRAVRDAALCFIDSERGFETVLPASVLEVLGIRAESELAQVDPDSSPRIGKVSEKRTAKLEPVGS
jgi:hypothetical protein